MCINNYLYNPPFPPPTKKFTKRESFEEYIPLFFGLFGFVTQTFSHTRGLRDEPKERLRGRLIACNMKKVHLWDVANNAQAE